MKPILNQTKFSRATEARFLLDAQRHGLLVSRPCGAARRYDAVVDNGRRLFRVRIKSAHAAEHARGRIVYRIVPGRCRFPRLDFDFIAVWLDEHTRWLFLPHPRGTCRMLSLAALDPRARRGWEVFAPAKTRARQSGSAGNPSPAARCLP